MARSLSKDIKRFGKIRSILAEASERALSVINVGGGMRGKRTVSCRNNYFGSHSYYLDTAVDKTAISRLCCQK